MNINYPAFFKFLLFASIAFFVPCLYVNCGTYWAKFEKTFWGEKAKTSEQNQIDEQNNSELLSQNINNKFPLSNTSDNIFQTSQRPVPYKFVNPYDSEQNSIFLNVSGNSEQNIKGTNIQENDRDARRFSSFADKPVSAVRSKYSDIPLYPNKNQKMDQEVNFAAVSLTPLEEIIRFDRYPNWMRAKWSRIDTVSLYQSESNAVGSQRGYRVSVVTGLEKDDLTGSLTYYFEKEKLRQISFLGKTGDFHKLLDFLQKRYRLEYQKTTSDGILCYESKYQTRKPDPPKINTLLIRPARTFSKDKPHQNFDVAFHLERPQDN